MYGYKWLIMIKRKKVLIVDDDVLIRMGIIEVLKKLTYVDFFEATNGIEAIEIAHNQHPHLILMDVLMPEMDGYEACKIIKNDPLCQSAIIIFMTGIGIDAINEKIIQAGGEDILRKPLNAVELFFRVKNYLQLAKARANNFGMETKPVEGRCLHEKQSIAIGKGFFYQTDAKVLCHNNQYIPLMKQEILLLEELLRHRNQVLTYDHILHVISANADSSIANIRTLVKLIRRKTYKELITTLPSLGYRITL